MLWCAIRILFLHRQNDAESKDLWTIFQHGRWHNVSASCSQDTNRLRESMREYTRELHRAEHENGDPLMRPLFCDFPDEDKCWRAGDQYMYGPKYLVAPVLQAKQQTREVYFPGEGVRWKDAEGLEYEGGQTATVKTPLDTMPVFIRQ
ncbi:hypothetical protein VDGE_02499 [Verticillium dahliae]|uniref:Glycosyl hydrolase family 31 C-terminal domain-containing protein n=1 Tax=Verticillium dahliae TaxID=27337 RepID=A0A444RUB1_VERDA|nr:hypothetical protein VDGE_02499 [Verticillium dahliae]